ncbi:hypothetical protein LV779_08420 [Streptomyces thinghirensis]|nr:hypothetical protein [Streptomyces thinghirensis]
MSLVRGDDGATGTPFPTLGHGREASGSSRRRTPARVASLARTDVRPRGLPGCAGGLVEYDGYSNDAWSYLAGPRRFISNIFIDVTDAWPLECPHADPFHPARELRRAP